MTKTELRIKPTQSSHRNGGTKLEQTGRLFNRACVIEKRGREVACREKIWKEVASSEEKRGRTLCA